MRNYKMTNPARFRVRPASLMISALAAMLITAPAFALQQPPNMTPKKEPAAQATGKGAKEESPKAKTKTPAPQSQTPAPKAGEAKGEARRLPKALAIEPIHDFGSIWAGPDLTHTFKIKNVGNAPLNIIRVKPACGCTTTGKHPKKIDPGQTGEFPFKLKSKRLKKFTKAIRITTNDPTSPTITLKLTGECKHHIDITPASAYFNKVFGDEPKTKTLKIKNNTDKKLELTLPTKANSRFEYNLKETVPGKEFDLIITLSPPFSPGRASETLVLKTNIPEQPEETIRLNATFPKRLNVRPSSLRINPTPKETNRVLFFTNNGPEPVEVTDVSVDDEKLAGRISWKARKLGRDYEIKIAVPAGYGPPASGRTLTIKTTDPQQPELKVTIVGKRASRRRPAEEMRGRQAPKFSTKTLTGQEFTSASLNDKVTVITFWAPNCPDCKKQLPRVEKIRTAYVDNDKVQFLNISQTMGKKKVFTDQEVVDVAKSLGAKAALATDPKNTIGPLFKATTYPTMFVIGKKGIIEEVIVGTRNDLEIALTMAVEKSLNPDLKRVKIRSTAFGNAKVKTPRLIPLGDGRISPPSGP